MSSIVNLLRPGTTPPVYPIPTLKRELLTRFVVSLVSAQMVFLATVGSGAALYLRRQQALSIETRASKSIELFSNIARYGDVRYARFLVRSNGGAEGLKDFRVHDLAGDEIQASDPERLEALEPEILQSAQRAAADQRSARVAHFELLKTTANASQRKFHYLLRTTDGAEYIITAAMEDVGLPWAWLVLAAAALAAFSVGLAVFLVRGRLRAVVTSIDGYSIRVRNLTAADDPSIEVPFGELLPVQTALAAMMTDIRDQAATLTLREKDAAVARMTGMLAHDVRKPFSILRMGLGMLSNAGDIVSIKQVLSRLLPEIDKAVSSVDGLIADVLEVGSTSTQLIQEPASPESLIEATLGEICRVYPKAQVAIRYDFHHTHMVNVHVQKVGRVLSNIVGNAVQAMGKKGEIWFSTAEHDGMIEFCVGNAGSVIPAENLPKLFDTFFTSGKKGGTGLGLAIAEKVVKAHGGKIWCESSKTAEHPAGKVEFHFTLPAAVGQPSCTTTAYLPQHTSEITSAILALTDGLEGTNRSADKGELTLEADILQALADLGRPIRVLIVDDEAVYRSALTAYLQRTPGLRSATEIIQTNGSHSALQALEGEPFDLVITDVDMGPDSLDGFELVREVRRRRYQALTCVHSNRIVAADHRAAIDAGADAFLPKPLARGQLLKLVLQAKVAAEQCKVKPNVPRHGATVAPQLRPEVLVLDDNPFVLDAWNDKLKNDATVHVFSSYEELADRLESAPGFADKLHLAITDLYLDGSSGDGLEVGRLLKKHQPTLRVLLSSEARLATADLEGAIDEVIGKEPCVFSMLNSL